MKKKLGDFLREVRGERSLGQIAQKSGIDKGYLSKVERNERKPKPDMIDSLAKAYGVSFGELMELSGYNADLQGIYLSFAKQAQDEGLDPDDIAMIIEEVKRLKCEK